jgi:hypothetical protein
MTGAPPDGFFAQDARADQCPRVRLYPLRTGLVKSR